jgi:hypothetical protein
MIITKQAYEEFWRYHNFLRSDGNGWLAVGETVSTCTVLVKEKITGTDVSATMVSGVVPDGTPVTRVKYYLKGGVSGTTYIIEIRCVTSTGQKFEDEIEVKVL